MRLWSRCVCSFIIGGMSNKVGEVVPEYTTEWDTIILGTIMFLGFFGLGVMSGIESKK